MASYEVQPLARLVEQFERLPGIGRKTAQRLAFYLLDQPKERAREFADALLAAHEQIHQCPVCFNLSDQDLCSVCRDPKRDRSMVCVVEDVKDVIAFERTREYNGLYHVLHGLISPIDGIGPEQLKIKELLARLSGGEIQEVIMATNPTVEGEATAMYLSRLLKPMGVLVTRIAHGVPVGSDLEYADEITLSKAMEGRREM